MIRHHNLSSRPKSQPPIKLSEMVGSGAANKRQHQPQIEQSLGNKLRSEEEQHWTKKMEKYEKSRSLRFSAARMSSRNLKTLCENQTENDCNTNITSPFAAHLSMLDLVPGEADISPLTSSSGSSGGSSLASSTLSLSSVSSASTVMAVESQKKAKSKPFDSRKRSLGSDEESSSNSSSCSSSSGISSIGQTAKGTAAAQVVDLGRSGRAVSESPEALVSSVAAGETGLLAPLALDALMVKVVPVGEDTSRELLNASSANSINQRSIINKCRRHIFNALTHAQKVGRREPGWRVELQLASDGAEARIRWFKEAHEIGSEDDSETTTTILAEHVIDCLVEHELVIWLVAPKSERFAGKSCELLESISANDQDDGGRQERQFDAKLAACSGGPSRDSESSSPVCGNLIGITTDCEQDQMIGQSKLELHHVESIIWLCSNELDAEQVQEAWREFSKRRQARDELVDVSNDGSDEEVEVEVAQMDAINSTSSATGFSLHANEAATIGKSIAIRTDDGASVEYVQVVDGDESQLSDVVAGGGDHPNDDDKTEQYEHDNPDESNQTAEVDRDVMEADSEEFDGADCRQRQQVAKELTDGSRRVPRGVTVSRASGETMVNTGQAPSVSTQSRLRRAVSVFNLTYRNDNHPKNHNEPLELRAALGSGLNSASSQFLTTCGADLTGKQGDASLVARHSVSSKIIKSLGQEVHSQSRLASPSNQIDRRQQQQRTALLKVGSTCDLSSSGQQLAGGRRLVSLDSATTKRTHEADHPQQPKAGNASANNVSTSAPVVKPRMSILKRQVAAGSCLLSSTKGYQQQQRAGAPSQTVVVATAAARKPAAGNRDDHKCDLKQIDRNRMGNSSRQQSSLESGGARPTAAAASRTGAKGLTASIDKLNDPFERGSYQPREASRRAVVSTDDFAQVVAVSSSSSSSSSTSSSVAKMSTKPATSKVAADEQLAPREIRPREAHRSSGDLASIKLDNQPRRLLIGATKVGAPNKHQGEQQQSSQSRGQSIEACDESQSSRQSTAMATDGSRLEKVLAKTPVAEAARKRHQQQQHEASFSQTTKTRRKAVHSLANCELIARHHQSQQQSVARAGDVTIKVAATRQAGDKSEVGGKESDCRQPERRSEARNVRNTNENDEVDFVASGSAAREQAFERLRQRASCYDITRLMSKNSIIQSQLARLKATGPSRSDSLAGSSNELRQRKPAELLVSNPGESPIEQSSISGENVERGREAPTRIKSRTSSSRRESIHVADSAAQEVAESEAKVRATVRSKVPVGGVAVLRHEETQQGGADCDQEETDESDEVTGGDGQSEKDMDNVRGDAEDKEEAEDNDEEQENKRKINPAKPAAGTGLSKFNLLRQSFNQKTISSMLKFSSRASLRIKTSKPAQENANNPAAAQEQQVTVANPAASKKQPVAASSKTSETANQQQQQQIAALDSATLMLYNRHMQQRQQQKIIQQQQQQQYALQWQQHQIYIQQQQQQQNHQQRQQLAFMANHYIASHQHQMLSGIQLAPSLASMGGFSTAASSMYAQQLMIMQQRQQQLQPVQSVPKASSSNVVGTILRKSILKSSSSKAKEELAAASRQMALSASQTHHYAHAPSQLHQSHGPMVPFEVNHHSSVNIVYGAESRAPLASDFAMGGGNPYQVNEYLDQLRQQQYAGPMAEVKETTPSGSSLKASMRKRVKSILINRAGDDQKSCKKPDESQARQTQLQPKPLKSALKSTPRRSESTLNLNSDGSDGDQSNSSTLESSSSSDRSNEMVPAQLKSALKKPASGCANTDERKLMSTLSNVDDSSTSSNSSDNSFKRAISARCSRRLTVKSSPKESTSEARVSMKPVKKNVTFSSKLTSIQ